MSESQENGFDKNRRVFLSSSTSEMQSYRDVALEVIAELGMQSVNYNDPSGARGVHRRGQNIFEMNRSTVQEADVFIGLYGFGEVWRPASHPGLVEEHPELMDDSQKLIMEYEWEWAKAKNSVICLPFVCTADTKAIPATRADSQMHDLRLKIMTGQVGWLTTPEAFRDELRRKLEAIRPTVFLSYSRTDEFLVSKLQLQLRDRDIFSWRDKVNIGGSVEWAKALASALQRMRALVVVVTPNSLKSKWVEKECIDFAAMGKPVFPYIAAESVKEELPPHLEILEWIDGTTEDGPIRLAGELVAFLNAAK